MNALQKISRTLSIATTGLLAAASAHAYGSANTCNGHTYTKNGSLSLMRNACSINEEGMPDAYDSYFDSVSAWDHVWTRDVTAASFRPQGDCVISLDDNKDEVARVVRSQIDGNNGLTTYSGGDVCIPLISSNDMTYDHTDVRIASDQDFRAFSGVQGISRATGAPSGGRLTMIHEMGHQLGLGHANALNVMSASSSQYPVNRVRARPFPDEVAGLAAFYGSKSLVDLFPSSQRFANGDVIDILPNNIAVCRGSTATITLHWTSANVGNTNQVFDQQIILSTGAITSNPIVWVDWLGGTVTKRAFFTWTFATPIPSTLPVGVYQIYHKVDPRAAIDEHAETDNHTQYKGRLFVQAC